MRNRFLLPPGAQMFRCNGWFAGCVPHFAASFLFTCHGTIHPACGATGIVGFTGGGVGTFGGPCAYNKRNESNLLLHGQNWSKALQ